METSKIIIAYLIYLPIILILTYFVSRTLFRSGLAFMMEIFKNKEDMAISTNQLFKVGYYLINLGFGLAILPISAYGFSNTYQEMIEVLSVKMGGYSIYLGVMLFIYLYLLFRGRRISKMTKPLTAITE